MKTIKAKEQGGITRTIFYKMMIVFTLASVAHVSLSCSYGLL